MVTNATGDLLIAATIGLKRALVIFLIDTWAQISFLTKQDAQRCGIVPSKSRCCVLNTLGTTETMKVALVKLILPGEENRLAINMVIGDIPVSLLRMNALAGRQWEDSEGFCGLLAHHDLTLDCSKPHLPYHSAR